MDTIKRSGAYHPQATRNYDTTKGCDKVCKNEPKQQPDWRQTGRGKGSERWRKIIWYYGTNIISRWIPTI